MLEACSCLLIALGYVLPFSLPAACGPRNDAQTIAVRMALCAAACAWAWLPLYARVQAKPLAQRTPCLVCGFFEDTEFSRPCSRQAPTVVGSVRPYTSGSLPREGTTGCQVRFGYVVAGLLWAGKS